VISLIILVMLTTDPKLPNGYTCDDVRRTVAEIGRLRAIALALENGLSLSQINQIRRACKV
jgi:hypothetical protein